MESKGKGMKCVCGALAEYKKDLKFNGFKVDGWICRKCKELYYHPEQIQKILLLNKLRKQKLLTKLGQIRSNLIVRVPREVGEALSLRKGERVEIKIEGGGMRIAKHQRSSPLPKR